ncbi:hypothetical protein O1D29_003528 [Vibrio cholerae]|nr:hypothetical protein [Vibrio cholerae]
MKVDIEKIVGHSVSWAIIGLLVGGISVLMTVNSYTSELQKKEFAIIQANNDLQNTISEIKMLIDKEKKEIQEFSEQKIGSMSRDQKKLLSKFEEIDKYLLEVKNVDSYYSLHGDEILSDFDESEIINKIKTASKRSEKRFLYEAINYDGNDYVRDIALKKYIDFLSVSDLAFLAKDWALPDDSMNSMLPFIPTHWERGLLGAVGDLLTEDNAIHFEKAIINALVNTNEIYDKKFADFIWYTYKKSDNAAVIKSLEKIMHLLNELELKESLSKAKERYHESLDKISESVTE